MRQNTVDFSGVCLLVCIRWEQLWICKSIIFPTSKDLRKEEKMIPEIFLGNVRNNFTKLNVEDFFWRKRWLIYLCRHDLNLGKERTLAYGILLIAKVLFFYCRRLRSQQFDRSDTLPAEAHFFNEKRKVSETRNCNTDKTKKKHSWNFEKELGH